MVPTAGEGPPGESAAVLRERIRVAITQKELAAVKAKAEIYKEQIDSYRRVADDAKQAAFELRITTQSILVFVPTVACIVVLVALARIGKTNRPRSQSEFERTPQRTAPVEDRPSAEGLAALSAVSELSSQVDALKSRLATATLESARDRVRLLDGLRFVYYQQADDFGRRGEWTLAIILTVHALALELEAADLTGDDDRLRSARMSMGAHGQTIIGHVHDFAAGVAAAQPNRDDLEQIRRVRAAASGELVQALTEIEKVSVAQVRI
jgi:hypothetical protein